MAQREISEAHRGHGHGGKVDGVNPVPTLHVGKNDHGKEVVEKKPKASRKGQTNVFLILYLFFLVVSCCLLYT